MTPLNIKTKRVFDVDKIKTIKWWQKPFLKLLPTYTSYDFGSTKDFSIKYKIYKGKIYIVDSEIK